MILTNRRKRKNISKGFHGKGGSRVLLLRMGRVDKGDRASHKGQEREVHGCRQWREVTWAEGPAWSVAGQSWK